MVYQKSKVLLKKTFSTKDVTREEKANFLNQLQMLAYGAGMFEEALVGANEVLALDNTEPAYFYNRALIYQKLGRIEEAAAEVDKFLELNPEPDEDHLSLAVDLFIKIGRNEDAEKALSMLQSVDPARAELIMKSQKKS